MRTFKVLTSFEYYENNTIKLARPGEIITIKGFTLPVWLETAINNGWVEEIN